MTYREKIQEMIEQIDKLYDDAEWLRDVADEDEKRYLNKFREKFFDAGRPLRQLDYNISDKRASMIVS